VEKNSVVKNIALKLLYIVIFILIWQAIVSIFHIKEFVLPSPFQVLGRLFIPEQAKQYHWILHISATLNVILSAFIVSIVLGILLAILICWSKLFSDIIMPIIVLFNSLPKIAFTPLFLIWFGYGYLPNLLIAFLVAFFPIVLNTCTGLMAVDDDLLDLVNYLGASKWQLFFKIRIPNSLPYIFAGIKISVTMCVMGTIVGEFVAAEKGLGYLLRDAQAFIDMPTMFCCLILLSVIGLSLFELVKFLEKKCMPWNNKEVIND